VILSDDGFQALLWTFTELCVLDIFTQNSVTIQISIDVLFSCAIIPNGKVLTADFFQQLITWDASTGAQLTTISSSYLVCEIIPTPQVNKFLLFGAEGLQFVDLEQEHADRSANIVTMMACVLDDGRVCIAEENKMIVLSPKLERQEEYAFENTLTAIKAVGNKFFIGCFNGEVCIMQKEIVE